MANTTYRDIPAKLRNLEPFNGNSMFATGNALSLYTVFSYGTEIARVEQGRVTFNDERYSTTTSRHQNLCKAWLNKR